VPDEPTYWTIQHFSQANPKGPGQDDVPALLRRVANTIEGMGAVRVQDLTFGTEITEDGPWHHLTVYFDSGERGD
jgi:hypothetical protein